MEKTEHAVLCFQEGFSCSQAVLNAFANQFGLSTDHALGVAGAFGGGMGHRGETCGAVTGAIMVIGLRYGKRRAEDNETRDKAYSVVNEFINKFKEKNGSILCKELLGYDMSIPEEYQCILDKKIVPERCPKFVRDAADIIEQLLCK